MQVDAGAAGRRRCAGPIAVAVAAIAAVAQPGFAAEGPDARGATVTVISAGNSCFSAIVEVFGVLIPREEVAVRPDRPGLKVADVLVDPGETVTAGQTLAKLSVPEGGTALVPAPVAGVVSAASAVIGAVASAKGEALFSIIPRNEFDLVGQVPVRHLAELAVEQPATVKIVGAGELAGKVRRVSATVDPSSQLGQVFVNVSAPRRLLANSSGRAMIKTGESCGVSVPLTAVLYGSAGTVVQVVRRQLIETRRVETGLMSGGQIEIRDGLAAGDVVVARAGALLREGDPVRPVNASELKVK
ncbi:efflux RND transporter periplasmic adaptor subunit [Rhodopseudomonas sp.]|uniref:efflux RND transporter periplasmic adaptor subunit n=1 Tax=Rhodopseudomonas sp. TaxID=1078 RepID=UPI0039C8CA6D